jgi:hypothetical protein
MMTNGDLLNMLVDCARRYRSGDVAASLQRNAHMSLYEGQIIDPVVVDAVLVDFLNYVGSRRGMDLGLYAADLHSALTPQPRPAVVPDLNRFARMATEHLPVIPAGTVGELSFKTTAELFVERQAKQDDGP